MTTDALSYFPPKTGAEKPAQRGINLRIIDSRLPPAILPVPSERKPRRASPAFFISRIPLPTHPMKTPSRIVLTALLPFAGLHLVSCSSSPADGITTKTDAGVPGGQVTDTKSITATVTGINAAARELTLVTPEGTKFTVVASPRLERFHQIRIGDRFKATSTSEVIIRMAKPGETITEGTLESSPFASSGASLGAKSRETHQFTGFVTAIDQAQRTATLRLSDGSFTTVPVRSDIDLSKRSIGERVVVRAIESMVVRLED